MSILSQPSRNLYLWLSAMLLSVVSASGANYFPLAEGNSWVLSGPGNSVMTMTVASTAQIGDVQRATVNIVSPWASYGMVLRSSSAGVQLEALQYPQVRAGYPELIMLFGEGSSGQSWPSLYSISTLVSDTNIITTAKGVYRNVRRYDIVFSGGAAQTWYLAPDVGPVQFGTTGAMTLTGLTLQPATVQTVTQHAPGPCPKVGITPNPPANGDFSTNGKEAILKQVLSGGATLVPISASWGDLEAAPNTYSFDAVTTYANWAAKYGVDALLTIKTIDTTGVSMPKDLAGSSWTDPQVIARWEAFLKALLSKLSTNVKWINLGNEVDTYLQAHPSEIRAYAEFMLQGEITLLSARPAVSTGVVFSFTSFHLNDSVFRALSPLCKHVGFTYYDQDVISTTSAVRDPANVPFDIADMIAAAAGKELLLNETGYPSSVGSGSSPALQQAFYANTLATLGAASGKVAAANFAFLSDLPPSMVSSLGASYGIAATLWMNWAGSLGLIDPNGIAKPGLQTFYTNAAKMRVANSCTIP
jgi:hypothetical protein